MGRPQFDRLNRYSPSNEDLHPATPTSSNSTSSNVSSSPPLSSFTRASLTPLPLEYRDRLLVTLISSRLYAALAPTLSLSGSHFPALTIETPERQRYTLDAPNISADAVAEFLRAFFSQSLTPSIRSQSDPPQNPPTNPDGSQSTLVVLTGNNFEDIVYSTHHPFLRMWDNTSSSSSSSLPSSPSTSADSGHRIVPAPKPDVFVMFHAPWCIHCKRSLPVFTRLSEYFYGPPHSFSHANVSGSGEGEEMKDPRRVDRSERREESEASTWRALLTFLAHPSDSLSLPLLSPSSNTSTNTSLFIPSSSPLALFPSLVLATFDLTQNDPPPGLVIEGFPTFLLFPAADPASPVQFAGRRTLREWLGFLEEEATHGESIRAFDDERMEEERRTLGLRPRRGWWREKMGLGEALPHGDTSIERYPPREEVEMS